MYRKSLNEGRISAKSSLNEVQIQAISSLNEGFYQPEQTKKASQAKAHAPMKRRHMHWNPNIITNVIKTTFNIHQDRPQSILLDIICLFQLKDITLHVSKSKLQNMGIKEYRLTSAEEPSDEILHELMEQVADSARKSSENARRVLAEKMQKTIMEIRCHRGAESTNK
jgi:hypothetical protein